MVCRINSPSHLPCLMIILTEMSEFFPAITDFVLLSGVSSHYRICVLVARLISLSWGASYGLISLIGSVHVRGFGWLSLSIFMGVFALLACLISVLGHCEVSCYSLSHPLPCPCAAKGWTADPPFADLTILCFWGGKIQFKGLGISSRAV